MSKPIRIYSTNEVFVFKSISSLISFNKQTKLYKSLELTQFEAPSTYYDVYSVVGLIEAFCQFAKQEKIKTQDYYEIVENRLNK